MHKISVILPVYNGIKYLDQSMNSVLSQEMKEFELLVIDDRSTDGSWEYLKGLNDDRICLYRNDVNRGLFYNLNYLVQKVNSPLLKLWSQDDVMYPDCLKEFVAFHAKYPAIGFSYCGTNIIDHEGREKHVDDNDNTPEIVSSNLHARIAFFTGSIAGNISNVCISMQALNTVGLFNEQMRISGDFDMWVRLAKEHDTGRISKKLIQLRDHPGQLSRNESLYIHHVREDLMVYQHLFEYVSPTIKKEGKQLLRNNKFVFYYTLMIKEFIRGRFGSGIKFFKALNSADNFFKLTASFIKAKLSTPSKPQFLE